MDCLTREEYELQSGNPDAPIITLQNSLREVIAKEHSSEGVTFQENVDVVTNDIEDLRTLVRGLNSSILLSLVGFCLIHLLAHDQNIVFSTHE